MDKSFLVFFSKKNSLLFEKRSKNFYPILPADADRRKCHGLLLGIDRDAWTTR
jgi:hypothetical protein